MNAQLNHFGAFAISNPAVIEAALEKEFGVASLQKVANDRGYEVASNDFEDLLEDMVAKSKFRISFRDCEGKMRELTLDEAHQAGGGMIGLAAVAVTIVVVVAVGAAVVTEAAVAVHAAVWGSTWAWTVSLSAPTGQSMVPGTGTIVSVPNAG